MPPARVLARVYFAAQAAAGATWWVAVFTIPFVRAATLGSLDAALVALFDIPLFVVASGFAALATGRRALASALVATAWTVVVTVLLAGYATFTGEAGWGVVFMTAASVGSIGSLCLLWLGRIPTEWALAGPFAFHPARSRTRPVPHMLLTFAQILIFWGLFLGMIPVLLSALETRWGLAASFPSAVVVGGWVLFVLASGLGLWSAAAMNIRGDGTPLPAATANRLVTAGPYRIVRNPMAVSGFLQYDGNGMSAPDARIGP